MLECFTKRSEGNIITLWKVAAEITPSFQNQYTISPCSRSILCEDSEYSILGPPSVLVWVGGDWRLAPGADSVNKWDSAKFQKNQRGTNLFSDLQTKYLNIYLLQLQWRYLQISIQISTSHRHIWHLKIALGFRWSMNNKMSLCIKVQYWYCEHVRKNYAVCNNCEFCIFAESTSYTLHTYFTFLECKKQMCMRCLTINYWVGDSSKIRSLITSISSCVKYLNGG